LRAQLEKKQGSTEEEHQQRQVPVAVAIAYAPEDGGAARLRDELEASLNREQELRAAVTSQVHELENAAARRAEELDERDAQLAAAEAAVAARERAAAEQLAEAEALRERITTQQSTLTELEARAAEKERQIEL